MRTVAEHEPVRGVVLGAAVRVRARGVRAARGGQALAERARRRALLGLVIGVLAGWHGRPRAAAYLIPLAAICAVLALRRVPARRRSLLLVVIGGDLAWQAKHQDQRAALADAPRRSRPRRRGARASCSRGSAAEGPFRIATAAPEPRARAPAGQRTARPGARALLLDQEALRLGLEDVAGYNPVHLKRYNRLMLASNGGRAVDRHFEFALRYATPQLRSLAVRYYVSPPGQRRTGLPVVYRDQLSVVTRDPEALPFARIVRRGRAAARRARRLARRPTAS